MSEFGQGFTYNLFLFAKHAWRLGEYVKNNKEMNKDYPEMFTEKEAVSLWFNGAADHLYDLEIPPQWKNHPIGRLARKLQNKGLRWRLEELGDMKDAEQFIGDCEKLMRMVDRQLQVKVTKADWN